MGLSTIYSDVRFLRGQEATIPTLAEGQPGFTKDTKRVFVGSNSGNVELAKQTDVKGLIERADGHDEDISTLNESVAENTKKIKPTKHKWVITADSQPLGDTMLAKWRVIRDHIANNQKDAELLIHAGDIVDNGDGYGETNPFLYADMLEDFRALPVPRSKIFTIPGNHDINMTGDTTLPGWENGFTYKNFLTAFDRQYYYTIQGNIVTIYMGSMARNTAGNIVDYVVDWWKEIVRTNQDKTIITVTHQPLQNTVNGSSTVGGSQLESSRFTSVLGTPGYRVDAWFSGHSGIDLNNPSVVDHVSLYGCMFVGVDMNVGLGADGSGGGAGITSSYVTMEFADKSNTISFTRWNVDDNVISKTWTVDAPHPVELSPTLQFDGRYQFNPKYDIITKPLRVTTNLRRIYDSGTGTWIAPATPTWVHHAMVEDRSNDDVTTGMGAGMLLYVPGANTGSSNANEPNINRAYGIGAAIAARRTSNAETDYSGGLSLYVSGAAADETSMLEAVYIDNAGHVGIGKTSGLSQAAHISSAGTLTYLRLENTAGATNNFDIGLGNTNDGFIRLRTPGVLRLYSNDVNRVNVTDTSFNPNTDNTYSSGSASNRWSQVYAGTATINTSDERLKQDWTTDLAPELRAWSKVEYGKYKFIDAVEEKGDKARWHFGLIAQRVKEAFESEGLDPFAYGVLCYDEWEEQPEIKTTLEDGTEEIIQEYKAAGNRYGIRYEEALALEAAYMRAELNALKARL